MSAQQRRAEAIVAVLLVLAVCTLYLPLLVGQQTFAFHDLRHHQLPWRAWAAATWAAGELPLWAPIAHGFPLMADGQAGVLYPGNLLVHRLFGPELAITVSVMAHHAWGVLGGYALARLFGRGMGSSVLAGVAYGMSGFVMTKLVYLGMFQVLAWVPWVAAAMSSGVLRGGTAWGWAALALGMLWLGGHPQLALYGSYIGFYVALWAAWEVRAERKAWPLAGLALAALGGVLVAAPQLYATLELAREGLRQGGVDAAFAGMGSLPPEELLGFVLPEVWGSESPAMIGETYHHHGEGYVGRGVTYWDICFYVGVPVSLLALRAGWLPMARMWWALAGLSVLLMLGEHTPLYGLFRLLPGMDSLRFPARAGVGVALAASQLAALGSDRLLRDWVLEPERVVRQGRVLMGTAGVLWLLSVVAWLGFSQVQPGLRDGLTAALVRPAIEAPAEGPLASVPPPPARGPEEAAVKADALLDQLEQDVAPWSPRVFWPLTLIGAFGLMMALRRGTRPPGRTLLGFVFVDLFVFAYGFNPTMSIDELSRPRTSDAFLGEPGPFRVTVLDRRVDPAYDFELMSSNLGLLWGAEDVIVPSPLRTVRNDRYLAAAGLDIGLDKGEVKVDAFVQNRKLADLSGLRFLTTLHDLDLPGLTLLDEVSVPGQDQPVRIYENARAMPRAFVVGCTRELGPDEDPLAALLEVDPRRVAVVEGPGLERCVEEPVGTVAIERVDSARLRAEVTLEQDGFLVFTETDYPGQKVVVDGERAGHVTSDYLFVGVPLAAGTHTVWLIYEPWRLLWVMLLSSLFTSLLLVGVVYARTRVLRRQWEALRQREQEQRGGKS